ncbi:amidohydrolase [Roseomonas nepalensis]|uniref:Amidohydrolase n=2 Tax=Muricoccus nepalensis TaxID=1854500 RepID=A0A502G9V3_9PROT|nr:amidohydrolase [Roseomonas nepalensis]
MHAARDAGTRWEGQRPTRMTTHPIIDCHFHLYTTDMPRVASAWHQPPFDATPEGFLEVMDKHGVTFGVIAAASMYGEYNDYTIRATRRHKRLRGTVILSPDADFYRMERMKEDGIVGVRIFYRHVASPPDLKSPEYQRLLRRVRDLNWHVHVLAESHDLPAVIEGTEAAGVKLVIDHFGRPDPGQGVNAPGFKAMLAAVERGNTWVKISAGYRMPSAQAARDYAAALLRVAGGERLVWGSDWPFAAFEDRVTYADAVATLADWVQDERVRQQIAGETPLRLYFSD